MPRAHKYVILLLLLFAVLPENLTAQVPDANLIVDGDACVGEDCTPDEIFGADTLRLRENNLRIHFDDTSSAPSFPSNDWRILINDNVADGANYWAIEDSATLRQVFRINAGAPASSLFVDATGDVGFGTPNPVVDAHILSGSTPTIRLEQDDSIGFIPQTWDLSGDEAGLHIHDVVGGTMPLRIRPGAPSSSLDIASNGNVGIGTASPNVPLHVSFGGPPFTFNASTALGIQKTTNADDGVILSLIGGTLGNAQIALGSLNGEFLGGRLVYRNNLDRLDIYTAGSVQMTLDSEGDLGIGTTSPRSAIHLVGTLPDLTLTDTVGDEYVMGNNNGTFRIRNTTQARTDFTIRGDGNVGIGTSLPEAPMHVDTTDGAAGEAEALLLLRNNGPVFLRLEDTSIGENWFIAHTSNKFHINSEAVPGTEFVLESDGDLGLGTPNPLAALHVQRSLGHDASLLVEDTDSEAQIQVIGNGGFTGLTIQNVGATSASTWVVSHGASGALSIDDTDLVHGPGGSQEFRVFSNGDVTISGSLTTGSSTLYPDYVFDADYQLMPLSDLAAFIASEGQLPNVPSQEEVKAAGGINVTELQITLLEKIEELTLYILQQEESINRLREQLKASLLMDSDGAIRDSLTDNKKD